MGQHGASTRLPQKKGAAESPNHQSGDYVLSLPVGFPPPAVPSQNPLTARKIELGRQLFKDPRLSVNATLSCASCHKPDLYFTDGAARPRGAGGELLEFNTPTLLNVAYSTSFSWIDKDITSLEEQHLGVLTNHTPVELGLGAGELARLSADPQLVAQLGNAFPGAVAFTRENLIAALASYIRTLIRGGTAFDRFLFADDSNALSPEARAGLALFSSDRLNCSACHKGFLLSGPTRSARASYEPSFYQTAVADSRLAFRAPSLRFIKHTAPYMHDGSMKTLEEVIEFYATAANNPSALGPEAAERMKPFELSVAETGALLAFLNSL